MEDKKNATRQKLQQQYDEQWNNLEDHKDMRKQHMDRIARNKALQLASDETKASNLINKVLNENAQVEIFKAQQ